MLRSDLCFFASRRRHTRCALVTGVQTCALPIFYDDVAAVADTSDPNVRQEMAAIETGYRIGRLMVLREVMGQAPKQFSAATKTFCTELEQRIAGFCASALGADAMLAEPGLGGRVARNLCYAPAYTIMGGTSQILRKDRKSTRLNSSH